MHFTKIETENWKRFEAFQYYSDAVPCTFSLCVTLDITRLKKQTDAKQLKFFPVILYGIAQVVNRHDAFRMGTDEDGHIGYYDSMHPSYTLFHEDTETITTTWTAYDPMFSVFYNNYLRDMATAERSKPLKTNVFSVSCIPWVSFTGFHLNLQKGYDYYAPIFTVGKFFHEGSKLLLPLAIQVHHAVCDGFHVSRFIDELQNWADHVPL